MLKKSIEEFFNWFGAT